jgi:hypothetical protein
MPCKDGEINTHSVPNNKSIFHLKPLVTNVLTLCQLSHLQDNVKVQQLINNLRHAQKFWTDKENLQQRKPGRQRKVCVINAS